MGQDSPVLTLLRARNLLREGEDELLRRPDVLALSPAAQLAYLRQNRGVGLFVTLFAGGIRLLILAGGLLGHVALTASGRISFSWWMPPLWFALSALLVWAALALRKSVRSLHATLPSYESLRTELEPPGA